MDNTNLHNGDHIRTFTGKMINPFFPHPDEIDILDIAHALSNMPRFAGHFHKFVSVAEHSLHVASMVSSSNKLAALLHDATEAYLMDIPSPIKRGFPHFKLVEENLMKVIALKFGFQYPFDPEIKEADMKSLEFEWENNMLNDNMTEANRSNIKHHFLQLFEVYKNG